MIQSHHGTQAPGGAFAVISQDAAATATSADPGDSDLISIHLGK